MDIPAYLERVKVYKKIKIDLETLSTLQENHLLNIPFENLDIHNGKEIKLSPDHFFKKLITDKRGGFCYELNGLFYILLKNIGFNVKLISGRVHVKDGNYGEEFDHLAIIATINNNQYLVDVGFGKFSLKPLLLKMNSVLDDQFGQFQFDLHNADYLRINRVKDGNLMPLYIFKNAERNLEDFEQMCQYHQKSADSNFTRNKIISIVTPDGRLPLPKIS